MNRDNQPNWTLILQVLGASAGLTAFVTFVGGALLWIRFNKLGLPADQGVALLPPDLLLTIGARALAVTIMIALLAVFLIFLMGPLDAAGRPRPALGWTLGVIVVAWIIVALFAIDLDIWPELLIMLAVSVGAARAILRTARRTTGFRPVGWVVFTAFFAVGVALVFVRTIGTPKLEPAAVLLKDSNKGVSGFYVGQTSDRLYLAPLFVGDLPVASVSDEEVDRFLEIPRDEVSRIAIRAPAGIALDQDGREQAQSLLEDLRAQEQPTATASQVITTPNPAATFAPLVHLHSHEKYWPASAGFFLRNSVLMWAHDHGCSDYVIALGEHTRPAERKKRLNEIAGNFDVSQLSGRRSYSHSPIVGPDCRDAERLRFNASQHTRPYDEAGRPTGLPKKEGFYLDLRNDKRNGERNVIDADFGKLFHGVPVYYEEQRVGSGQKAGRRITYWFFYALSKPPGVAGVVVHEGDWERISILLRDGRSNEYIPHSVRYHFHNKYRNLAWGRVRKASDGQLLPTHPVAYSAKGSHASYPRPGKYSSELKVRGVRIGTVPVTDKAQACPVCPQWWTWKLLRNARAESWYDFGGTWGEVGRASDSTGPLGPSRDKSRGLEEDTTVLANEPVLP